MLIGSTSSVTPPFSTRVSPSSEFSSKVKPYWKPEQPPPCTKTRSFRFGIAFFADQLADFVRRRHP